MPNFKYELLVHWLDWIYITEHRFRPDIRPLPGPFLLTYIMITLLVTLLISNSEF